MLAIVAMPLEAAIAQSTTLTTRPRTIIEQFANDYCGEPFNSLNRTLTEKCTNLAKGVYAFQIAELGYDCTGKLKEVDRPGTGQMLPYLVHLYAL